MKEKVVFISMSLLFTSLSCLVLPGKSMSRTENIGQTKETDILGNVGCESEGYKKFIRDGYYGLVVCPREEGNPRNTPASLIKRKDGSLLLLYSRQKGRADEAMSVPCRKVSTDGGFSWGKSFEIFPNKVPMGMHAGFFRLHSGKIVAMSSHMNDYNDLKIYYQYSEDECVSFSEPVLITPRAGYNCGNRLVQLDNGRLLYPVHYTAISRAKNESYVVLVYYSDDEGKSWIESKSELKLPKRGAMEPAIAEIKEGKCMMLIRTQLGYQYQSFSEDGGQTWSEPESSALVSPEAGAYLTRIPSTGDLLACWNYDFKPHWSYRHYGLRSPLTCSISSDCGRTWENIKDIEDDHRYSFGNPFIYFFDDKAYILYYVGEFIDEWGMWDAKLTIVPESFFYDCKPLHRAQREMPKPTNVDL